MTTPVHLRPPKSIIGPPLSGNAVIYEGRIIPRLRCNEEGDSVCIVVDGRMAFTFPKALAYVAAGLAAECLAVGSGYSHSEADAPGRPFAPEYLEIGS